MSGIVGLWNMDGEPVPHPLLAGLSARLAHRGPDAEGQWIRGSVGLACRLLRVMPEAAGEVQPLQDGSGAVLVFDGRLDNREDLLARLPRSQSLTTTSPDPVLVLAAYHAFGDRFPEQLLGDFALGLFDPGRERLLLARDPIGIRPLYYCHVGETLLFASEIKAILAHPLVSPRPHEAFLANFLLEGGRDVQGLTAFVGIFSLPPAHLITVANRRLVSHRYWDFDPASRTRYSSFPAYVEAFRHYFEQAVRRRMRSARPVVVSVSGGLDSSSIFCMAETLKRKEGSGQPPVLGITDISPAGSPSDEARYVVEIERAYGRTIDRLPMQMGLLRRADEAMRSAEMPMLDDHWNTTEASYRAITGLGAGVLLTGHWGDQVLFAPAYLVDLCRRGAWRQALSHLEEFGRWFTDVNPTYCRRQFARDLVRYSLPRSLFERLRRFRRRAAPPWYSRSFRASGRIAGPHPPRISWPSAYARSLYEETRSNSHVLCMEWNNKMAGRYGLDMAFPFLDRDLLAFLISIPGDMLTWKGVPKALLREAMKGILPDPIRKRTWKADFSQVVSEGMAEDYPQIARFLRASGRAVTLGYVNGQTVTRELDQMKAQLGGPHSMVARSFSDFLALELWLEVFCGGDGSVRDGLWEQQRELATVQGGTA